MRQRISEMETRSKYLVEWIDLPCQPRGLLCLDFDRTLLKVGGMRGNDTGHTIHAGNDRCMQK